jgi:hypothetical protein
LASLFLDLQNILDEKKRGKKQYLKAKKPTITLFEAKNIPRAIKPTYKNYFSILSPFSSYFDITMSGKYCKT